MATWQVVILGNEKDVRKEQAWAKRAGHGGGARVRSRCAAAAAAQPGSICAVCHLRLCQIHLWPERVKVYRVRHKSHCWCTDVVTRLCKWRVSVQDFLMNC